MKSVLFASLIVTFSFTPIESRADGNELLSACRSIVDILDSGETHDGTGIDLCINFVRGAKGVLEYWHLEGESAPVCFPQGVDSPQMIRIYVKYLKDNPSRLHEHAILLFIDALADAWPCSEN